MTTVERIKAACKSRGISVARMERDCGFGNGYLNNLKSGEPKSDRLFCMARYLGVSPEELMGLEKPIPHGDGFDIEAAIRGLCEDDLEKLRILLDALEADPEKTKAKFALFLATL